MKIKKVAIIGSNSFSGSSLVDYLLTNTSWDILGISRSSEPPKVFLPYYNNADKAKKFRFFKLDVNNDFNKLFKLLDKERPEIIVNFAAQSNVPFSWKHPEQWFTTNCLGIIRLANHLQSVNYLEKYVQISTPEVYGSCNNFKETLTYFNPTTPYAASKAAGDLYLMVLLKNFSFPVSFVRSANVYGPHQQLYRIVPNAIITLKKNGLFSMRAPNVRRNFVHIEDVSRGIQKIINIGKPGAVYHFSAGKNITMEALVRMVSNKLGLKAKDAIRINKQSEIRDNIYNLNHDKTSKILNWKPQITLEQGVDQVIGWINNNWQELKGYPNEYIHKK